MALIKLEYPPLCRRCDRPVVYVVWRRAQVIVCDAAHKFELINPATLSTRGRKIHECRK